MITVTTRVITLKPLRELTAEEKKALIAQIDESLLALENMTTHGTEPVTRGAGVWPFTSRPLPWYTAL